jgi:hypothetical protein
MTLQEQFDAAVRDRQCGQPGCRCAKSHRADRATVHCPLHPDEHPSLDLRIGERRILMICRSQHCEGRKIIKYFYDQGVWAGQRRPGLRPQDNTAVSGGQRAATRAQIVAEYTYCNEDGHELFQTVRYEPKTFKQRRPNGHGGWIWNRRDVRLVPYRLPELLAAPKDAWIFYPEGEGDVEALRRLGLPATTNPLGAEKMRDEYIPHFAGRKVAICEDHDQAGARDVRRKVKSLTGTAQVVVVLRFPDLPEGGDISDWITRERAAGRTDADIRAALIQLADDAVPVGAVAEAVGANAETDAAEPTWRSQATILTKLVLQSGAELFRTPDRTGFATVPADGHRETWRIKSTGMRLWLRHRYYTANGGSPYAQAVTDALEQLESQALFVGAEHPVFVRIGEAGGNIYVDLANDRWEVIEVSSDGWRVLPASPVRFQRMRGTLPLPYPTKGGKLLALRRFIHVETSTDFRLVLSWLVMALWPRGPYPPLIFEGPQGSAKSLAQRLLRMLIDPHTTPLRSEPKEVRDLMIAATNGWIAGFDNISYLGAWLSDALCRLATGAGFATRALYLDQDEVLLSAMRPVLLNGIVNPAVRPDLLERSLIFCLPDLSDEQRRDETDLLAEFERKRPAILGALLTVLSRALRVRPRLRLSRKPRMADFAMVGAAAARALGWTVRDFLRAYAENRGEANQVALEASPLTAPILALLEARPFVGTASDLLAILSTKVEEAVRRRKGWPGSGSSLSGALRRLAPSLRSIGIVVTFRRSGKEGRILSLVKIGESPSPSSPSLDQEGKTQQNGPSQTDLWGDAPQKDHRHLSSPSRNSLLGKGDAGRRVGDGTMSERASPQRSESLWGPRQIDGSGDGGDDEIPTLSQETEKSDFKSGIAGGVVDRKIAEDQQQLQNIPPLSASAFPVSSTLDSRIVHEEAATDQERLQDVPPRPEAADAPSPQDVNVRVQVILLGDKIGYRRYEYAPGRAIAAGVPAWKQFVRWAPDEDIRLAMQSLLAR